MEKIEEWAKTCINKKKLNEEVANSIIKKSEIPLGKYRCPHCDGWHLTSKASKNHNKDTNIDGVVENKLINKQKQQKKSRKNKRKDYKQKIKRLKIRGN